MVAEAQVSLSLCSVSLPELQHCKQRHQSSGKQRQQNATGTARKRRCLHPSPARRTARPGTARPCSTSAARPCAAAARSPAAPQAKASASEQKSGSGSASKGISLWRIWPRERKERRCLSPPPAALGRGPCPRCCPPCSSRGARGRCDARPPARAAQRRAGVTGPRALQRRRRCHPPAQEAALEHAVVLICGGCPMGCPMDPAMHR